MSNKSEKVIDVVFRVRRYDPGKDNEPYYDDFKVPVPPGMVVLDGLWYIKWNLDSSLAWRSSCRMGVCGSCGMLINGRAMLACNTQVRDVTTDVLVVAPLPNFDIIRDLVPDLTPMFDRHRELKPYIQRADVQATDTAADQYWQSPEDLERYLQFSYCIKCGACMAACPIVATDTEYSGPQPLAQAYRYMVDTRNGDFSERKALYATGVGPWRCHYAGECSAVCPKGVDPARAIQLMKRELVLDYLRLGKLRKREPCGILPTEKRSGRREGIPDPPPFTVEGAE
ncbi:succinate dehydrogenase/fumarate reductase iron-sulfur subunit [Gemmatimonadota bacterium]